MPIDSVSVKNLTDEKLCEVIAISRYLGSLQDQAILCMEELASRRLTGNEFNYEECVDIKIKLLPNFKLDLKKKINFGWDLSVLKNIK